MNVQAIGVYLDHLIELRGLKIKAVSARAGVKSNYISRLRTGDTQAPSAAILRALTRAAGASWDDVGALLDADASTADAQLLAEAWFRAQETGAPVGDELSRRLAAARQGIRAAESS